MLQYDSISTKLLQLFKTYLCTLYCLHYQFLLWDVSWTKLYCLWRKKAQHYKSPALWCWNSTSYFTSHCMLSLLNPLLGKGLKPDRSFPRDWIELWWKIKVFCTAKTKIIIIQMTELIIAFGAASCIIFKILVRMLKSIIFVFHWHSSHLIHCLLREYIGFICSKTLKMLKADLCQLSFI